jgi:hypothetical protein
MIQPLYLTKLLYGPLGFLGSSLFGVVNSLVALEEFGPAEAVS